MLVHNKWNAILSKLLYSCTLIFHSCVNIVPVISQAVQQPGIKHLTLFLKKSVERTAKYIEFVVSVHRVFLLLIGRVPLWPSSTQVTRNPFCWSSTPKPPAGKTVLKTHTNTKRKMWCCSVLRDLQFLIIAPVRNNVKHETTQLTQITVI